MAWTGISIRESMSPVGANSTISPRLVGPAAGRLSALGDTCNVPPPSDSVNAAEKEKPPVRLLWTPRRPRTRLERTGAPVRFGVRDYAVDSLLRGPLASIRDNDRTATTKTQSRMGDKALLCYGLWRAGNAGLTAVEVGG